jgi:hypothetical protein
VLTVAKAAALLRAPVIVLLLALLVPRKYMIACNDRECFGASRARWSWPNLWLVA